MYFLSLITVCTFDGICVFPIKDIERPFNELMVTTYHSELNYEKIGYTLQLLIPSDVFASEFTGI